MEINDIKEKLKEFKPEQLEELIEGTELKKKLNEKKEELAKKIAKSRSSSFLDSIQERVISRKLLVFAAATSLFMWFGLDADTWGMIAMMYIGGQSAIDFAKIWKGQ